MSDTYSMLMFNYTLHIILVNHFDGVELFLVVLVFGSFFFLYIRVEQNSAIEVRAKTSFFHRQFYE